MLYVCPFLQLCVATIRRTESVTFLPYGRAFGCESEFSRISSLGRLQQRTTYVFASLSREHRDKHRVRLAIGLDPTCVRAGQPLVSHAVLGHAFI